MPPASSPSKRTYESAVRREQLEQTRERIVDALVEQVWEERLTDFSVPKVAKRAGVSTRTVYRHFPTRDDLLDAVGARLIDRAPHPAPPESFDEMPAYTGRLFDWFAKNRRAVIVNNVSADERFYPGVDREISYRTVSVLAAPLIGGDQVLGVVEVLNKRDGRLFSVGNQTLLNLMCRFAGELLCHAVSGVDLSQTGALIHAQRAHRQDPSEP